MCRLNTTSVTQFLVAEYTYFDSGSPDEPYYITIQELQEFFFDPKYKESKHIDWNVVLEKVQEQLDKDFLDYIFDDYSDLPNDDDE